MNIENVFLFVSDSLRWDYLPNNVAERGVTFKTVAQSLSSPASFSTLSTGLYPPEHGALGWDRQIPEHVPRIFDVEGVDTGFYDQGEPGEVGIYSVLRTDKSELSALEQPFIHLERDPGPHQPLAGASTAEEYFRQNRDDWRQFRADYSAAVDESMARLETRIDELRDRGILDSTLVVVTSDHGELLGEHGCVSHNAPAAPELVYVPTTFIHPEIDEESFVLEPATDVIEHVDVVETVLSAANHGSVPTSGVDLLSSPRSRDWGYNYMRSDYDGRTVYLSESMWWDDGGHAFHRNSRLNRLLYVLYHSLKGKQRHARRRHLLDSSRLFLSSANEFGTPPMGAERAGERLADFVETLDKERGSRTEVDRDVSERLEELGYINT